MQLHIAIATLAALVAGATAEPPLPNQQYLPQKGNNGAGAAPGGQYDDGPSEPASYQFQYAVQDAASGNDFGHEEMREGDFTRGKYYVLLPDGRRQVVQYTADQDGYHPQVSYEGGNGGGGGGNDGYPASGYNY